MNIQQDISTLMTKKVLTINPKEKLQEAKNVFEANNVHHLPVVEDGKVLGMLSMSDLLYFLKGKSADSYEDHMNKIRLKNYTVEEIMTKKLAKLGSRDSILTALKVFEENLFHAIPIIDNEQLVGILSTQDIIKTLIHNKKITQ